MTRCAMTTRAVTTCTMTTRLLIFAAALLLPHLAAAQAIPCAPRERVLDFLIDRMGETRRATGTAGTGAQMEVFAGDDGSWTILLHLPDGRACIMANGHGFEATGGLQPARGVPA